MKRPIALATCGLLFLGAHSVCAQSISGRVVDATTGGRIGSVAVELIDTTGAARARTLADSAGAFRVRVPIHGVYRLRAQMLGYATVESEPFQVDLGTELEVEVTLDPEAVVLEPIRVVARRNYRLGRLGEYYDRAERARRTGFGRIFMRDDIENLRPIYISHMLAMVPTRRNCPMAYFLDGMPSTLAEIDMVASPEMIEGVEVYRSAIEVPPEYGGRTPCGATLVWIRRDIPGSPFKWMKVVIAVGVVALFRILMR